MGQPLAGRRAIQALLFAFGSLCYALLGILSQLSKSEDGTYAYSLPTVVLTAEVVKLVLSCAFLTAEQGSASAAWRAVMHSPLSKWLAFAVPSALYSLNNNLDMLNNQHMDPATEQVLVQCKILTTGIVWWLVFREPLGVRKWGSLLLLFLGAILAGRPSEALLHGGKQMHIDRFGMVLVTVYVWVSACAGVYNEWLYKFVGKADSIHACNIRLYTIGVLFNLGAHLLSDPGAGRSLLNGGSFFSFFDGYNRYVWALWLLMPPWVCSSRR